MINLINGDSALKLKEIESESIDMILTSPPYDNLRTYNDSCVWDFNVFKTIAGELVRVLKTGGTIVWIVNDACIDGSESGTSFRQALYFKDELGMNIHDTMIWKKPTFTDTGSLKVRYAGVFEYMFIFTKGKIKTFNPIKDRRVKEPGRSDKHGCIRQKDGSMKPMSSMGKKYGEYGQRFNVWEINTLVSNTERTGHPAQFPEELVHDHIISWSNEDDTILDPFMGSGTTGVVCINTNRNFIGIEKDKNYFDLSSNRIKDTLPMFKQNELDVN